MGYRASDYCISIVALENDNFKYGMTCAWMMQVDYDKIVCLLGSESNTGNVIKIGSYVGVSTLSKNQGEIALKFGDSHSKNVNKFKDVEFENKNGAICIKHASREMFCEVMDILSLKEIEDKLIYLRIVEYKENNNEFLHYGDL